MGGAGVSPFPTFCVKGLEEAAKLNEVSSDYLEFDIGKWPTRKKIKGTKCKVKLGKWEFDIWKWPKRKKEGRKELCVETIYQHTEDSSFVLCYNDGLLAVNLQSILGLKDADKERRVSEKKGISDSVISWISGRVGLQKIKRGMDKEILSTQRGVWLKVSINIRSLLGKLVSKDDIMKHYPQLVSDLVDKINLRGMDCYELFEKSTEKSKMKLTAFGGKRTVRQTNSDLEAAKLNEVSSDYLEFDIGKWPTRKKIKDSSFVLCYNDGLLAVNLQSILGLKDADKERRVSKKKASTIVSLVGSANEWVCRRLNVGWVEDIKEGFQFVHLRGYRACLLS
ncbi:hypothetical protein Tco_0792803 [Tanacetum coccineum]